MYYDLDIFMPTYCCLTSNWLLFVVLYICTDADFVSDKKNNNNN